MRLQKKKEISFQEWMESLFATDGFFSRWRSWLPQGLLIVATTLWIYWPALHGGFLRDDDWYFSDNPLVKNLTGLWKFWFQPGSWVEYYPIDETAMWLEWHLWGTDTLGYHLANLVLHAISALLVWRLLSKFGLRLAWLGGLIFAVHQAQAETVAYIDELKSTLAQPFFLLAMCNWIDYEEEHRSRDYWWAFALFVVGMLTKITFAPFPFVILLYAAWKRGKLCFADFKAATPFLVVALALAFLTHWTSQRYMDSMYSQAVPVKVGGLFSRLAVSGEILAFYFSRSFLPLGYLPDYPQWPVKPYSLAGYALWITLIGGLYWLWRKRRSWGRHLVLGIGFFILVLAPFLGGIGISYMSFTWAADHFLYLPIIGLIGLGIAGLDDLTARLPPARSYIMGGALLVTALLAWETHSSTKYFLDDEALWRYDLQHDPDNWFAHLNLGSDLMNRKQFPEAIAQYQETLRLEPEFNDAHASLAMAYRDLGRMTEAEAQFRLALQTSPDSPNVCYNLGKIDMLNGNTTEGIELLTRSLKAAPDKAAAYINNLGSNLLKEGRLDDAIELFQKAVDANPDIAQLQYNLGNALLQTGLKENLPQAALHLDKAVTLDPKIAAAHENFGVALAQLGHVPEAIEQFQAALQLDPKTKQGHDNLGFALTQAAQIPEAMEEFQKALADDPYDEIAQTSLAKLLEFQKEHGGAAPGGQP